MLVVNKDGSLMAGIFVAYNNVTPIGGDHYLIEERGASEIIVRHPMGADTSLKLTLSPGWRNTPHLSAWAYTHDDRAIGAALAAVSGSQLTFMYRAQMGGQQVAYYTIAAAKRTYLPLIFR